MLHMSAAAAGMAAALLLGAGLVKGWGLWNRLSAAVLAAGACVVFLLGGYVMGIYQYHILKMVRYWILLYALVLLGILDAKEQVIPNRALLVLLGVRTLLLLGDCICFPELLAQIILSSATGLLGGGFLFLVAGIVARKGIGMGDVKLVAVMGYYLGFQVLMSDLVITMTLTMLGGMAFLVFRRASLRSQMPFAPFAAVGSIITILLGF